MNTRYTAVITIEHARLQELFQSGSVSERVLTKDVLDSVNRSLLSTGEVALSPSEVGRLVRLAFGPQVDRKSAKVHGVRSYVYCGIRKKMMGNTAKRPCLQEAATSPEGTGAASSSTVDHLLQQVMQLNEELRREKQYR